MNINQSYTTEAPEYSLGITSGKRGKTHLVPAVRVILVPMGEIPRETGETG